MSLQDKINEAVETLKQNMSRVSNAVYFSGGKDSCVLKHLIETNITDIPVDFYYIETSFEPQVQIEYLKRVYPDVKWIKAKKNIFDIFREHGRFPIYKDRFCCKEIFSIKNLSEAAQKKKVILAQRNMERSYIEPRRFEPVSKRVLRPMYNWTTAEVWEYIDKYNLEVVKTYEMYGKQSNCFICSVMALPEVKKKKLQCHPEDAAKLKDAIISIWKGSETLQKEFATSEDYWNYYVEYDPRNEFEEKRLTIQVSNTEGSKFTNF